MGQKLAVDWQETAPELRKLYRKERNSERRTRLHALWLLRCGKSLKEVAQLVGIAYRTLQYWVAWYRQGGLTEVLSRIKGHGRQGRPSHLQPLQQKALAAKVALGAFRTVWDALHWVQGRWRVGYSYGGLHKCLKRLDCRPKVPRPCSINADVAAQARWKATGLREALREAGVGPSQQVWFCDEMRFGLWGQVRKRWGLRGVKIIQPIQIEFAWQYLILAVDVVRCNLYWAWADRMNQTSLLPILRNWSPDAAIWDGASAHRGKAMGELNLERIFLLPYSPELNPCERVFEWLRARIEGVVYMTLHHKRCEIEHQLRRLNADKGHLKSLIGWQWIQNAFAQLSA